MTYFMQRVVFLSVFVLGVVIHGTKGDDSTCSTKVLECSDLLPKGFIASVAAGSSSTINETFCGNTTLMDVLVDVTVCVSAAYISPACADTTNLQVFHKMYKELGLFDKNRVLESITYGCSHLEVFKRLDACKGTNFVQEATKCAEVVTQSILKSEPICQILSTSLQCVITRVYPNCAEEDIAVMKTLNSKSYPPGCVNGGFDPKYSVHMIVFMIVSWLLLGNL